MLQSYLWHNITRLIAHKPLGMQYALHEIQTYTGQLSLSTKMETQVSGNPRHKNTIRTRMANTVRDRVVQSRHFGWQPAHELVCDQVRCPGSKWLLFFFWKNSWKDKVSYDENGICTANGWLEDHEQQFLYNGIRTLEKRWTKCISVAGEYVKKWRNMMCDLVFNCVGLRTFWTPLVVVDMWWNKLISSVKLN